MIEIFSAKVLIFYTYTLLLNFINWQRKFVISIRLPLCNNFFVILHNISVSRIFLSVSIFEKIETKERQIEKV